MGSKTPVVILMMVTLVCASIPPGLGALLRPTASFAQEGTSLGEEEEEENFARSIVSNVLGGSDNNDNDGTESDSDADNDESNQDAATNTAIEDSDQGQIVHQDDTITFGDDTADLDDANVAVPLATPLDIDVIEEEPSTITPTPPDEEEPPECAVEIVTNKEIYEPEDVVAITITNTGDVPMEFPDSALGLQIKNVDSEEVLFLDAQPVVVTFEPGASATFQFTYEDLVSEIGAGLISATVSSECGSVEEVTFRLSEAPPPEENEKIAFASIRDGNFEIYVMNADGSEQQRLTNNAAGDAYPSWSPDGTKIAFASNRDNGWWEIYVMNADGSEQQRLTNNARDDLYPSWSPDGTKIAFASNRDSFVFEIYVMNADGSEQQRLTNNALDDIHPSWSPDGTKIAFASTRPTVFSPPQIYVMNADGSEQHSITPPTAEDETNYYPSWSPDGTKIAFSSTRPNGGFEIFTMNADGSDEQRMTNNPFLDVEPSWSPDGTKIAFETDRDPPRHPRQIYVMNADGSEQHNISNNPDGGDLEPDWGPAADTH